MKDLTKPAPAESKDNVADALQGRRTVEIQHEKSGVCVRVKLSGKGYDIDVVTASLDARRGQRHRARRAVEDMGWRLYDGDTGSGSAPEGVDENAKTWGYSIDSGTASDAADEALRLLRKIADISENEPVRVFDL